MILFFCASDLSDIEVILYYISFIILLYYIIIIIIIIILELFVYAWFMLCSRHTSAQTALTYTGLR